MVGIHEGLHFEMKYKVQQIVPLICCTTCAEKIAQEDISKWGCLFYPDRV